MKVDQDASRSDWAVFLIAVGVSAFALCDGNYALIVASLGVPISLVWLIRMLIDGKHRSVGLCAVAYGGAVLILASGPAGLVLQNWRAEIGTAPAIVALEKFHNSNGRYPDKLDELKEASAATCGGVRNKVHYAPDSERSRFTITCVTFGMNHHSYDSESKRWRNWD